MMENTIKNKNIGHADDVVNRLTFLNQELGPMLQCLLSMMVFIENINRTTFYGTYDDFDKDGNAKGMSENDVKKYKEMRMKLY